MNKILAIASTGGHWVQLLRLRPAFSHLDVTYVSTNPDSSSETGGLNYYCVSDSNFDTKFRLLVCSLQVLFIIIKIKPDYILTTGAAPGFFAVLWGKIFGAKTIWIDSIANSERLSFAGRHISFFADIWLTQWPELEREQGPFYLGNVL